MAIQQIRASATAQVGIERCVLNVMPFLALMISLLAFSPLALACGGGGSGSYRKPPRPGHQHNSTALSPQAETPANTTPSPAKN
jgi:hypothetical protein